MNAPRLRRFEDHARATGGTRPHLSRGGGGAPGAVKAGDIADVEAHTRYQKRVVHPSTVERVLKSGHHSRKIGKVVTKGRLVDCPIYTLTLEERATCPRTCHHWLTCYGNAMNWSQRLIHGPALEAALDRELRAMALAHPDGFLVRLHVLGDFYSVAYVERWRQWIEEIGALFVYGYTAWPVGTPIGDAAASLARDDWHRFAVRSSARIGEQAAQRSAALLPHGMVPRETSIEGAIVCPEQVGKAACCATCGLCWGTQRNIAFVEH